jgi:hypothetical protein
MLNLEKLSAIMSQLRWARRPWHWSWVRVDGVNADTVNIARRCDADIIEQSVTVNYYDTPRMVAMKVWMAKQAVHEAAARHIQARRAARKEARNAQAISRGV